jgi:site-specific recombinase XerD
MGGSAGRDRSAKAQSTERLAARMWEDTGLVFTTSIGTALEPRNVNREWQAACDKAGVGQFRIHDLRHAAATYLFADGIDLKIVQATLRHSRLSTTADLYTDVLEEVQRTAADRMNGMLARLTRPAGEEATGRAS